MKLNFKEQLTLLKKLNCDSQYSYFEKVSQNILIGIRIITNRIDLNEKSKIDAIIMLNEFGIEINNMKKDTTNLFEGVKLEYLLNQVRKLSEEQNGIIQNELFFCLDDAFSQVSSNSL